MSLRMQAVRLFADTIAAQLPDIATVEVVAAPPSKPAKYPACAVLVDSTDYWLADDFVPVDVDGNPLIGTDAIMGLPADWARFDENTLVYSVGRVTMKCRVFVATRLPEQRAELEDQIFSFFMADDLAPGRILMSLDQPRVMSRTLPFAWPVAALLPEADQFSQWTAEYAFDERLWAWLKCEVEVDMLVARNAPEIKQLILEMVTGPVDPVTGLVTDKDIPEYEETVLVDQSGQITTYP